MVKLIAALLLSLGIVSGPAASTAQGHLPSIVRPDRILIGTEFVPRYLDLPRVLSVPRGTTLTAPAESTWDYIEVSGTLRVARDRDTILRFTHLIVLPGGVLDAGTQTDPIPASRHVEFVVRDVPIDTTRDPFQWGNGLLNFGRQDRCGAAKLAWTTLTQDVHQGETTITLADDPQGWQAGDMLLVPDTAGTSSRRERSLTISSVDGRTVTLSRPLDFDHLAQRDPDGGVVLLPRVANLTRNVVVRSEQQAGTPGHTVNVGHNATWCICYNELRGLGRTRAETLNDTTADLSHIGTNQRGRYADHNHHAMGFGSQSVGNVLRGSGAGGGKWGVVVHGTHDALIERNIAIEFFGSGFVTEDGYEVRNVFRKNFAAYMTGNSRGATDIAGPNVSNRNNPGSEGAGFWFRGIGNTFDGNEAWNNQAAGMNLFNQFPVAGSYPSQPGGALDTPFVRSRSKPVAMRDNVTASNSGPGLEYWGTAKFPNERHISSYQGMQMFVVISEQPLQPYLVNPTFVGLGFEGTAIHSSASYTASLDIEGGRIVGHRFGVMEGGGSQHVRIVDTTLQNQINLQFNPLPFATEQINVKHVPVPGMPLRFVILGDGKVWPGGTLPEHNGHWLFHSGTQHTIRNWQDTGKDYRVFEFQQFASTKAWPSAKGEHRWNSPEDGLTMGQSWAKYGLAYGAEAVDDAVAGKLEGLEFGVVREGLGVTVGPPRAIVTFPTPREPAIIESDASGPYIQIHGMVTGDRTKASPVMRVSVDGGPPRDLVEPPVPWVVDSRRFYSRVVSPGTHEIRALRLDVTGTPIAGSEMTFHYVVGALTEPQTPPR